MYIAPGTGDLEISWHERQAMIKAERAKFKKAMRSIRKDSLAAWVCSLKEGDEVVVRFPWRDKDCPGGQKTKAWVKTVREKQLTVQWMTFNGDISTDSHVFYKPYGGGGSYHVLEHPTRKVVYSPDFGYEFEDRLPSLRRSRKAWATRRAKNA